MQFYFFSLCIFLPLGIGGEIGNVDCLTTIASLEAGPRTTSVLLRNCLFFLCPGPTPFYISCWLLRALFLSLSSPFPSLSLFSTFFPISLSLFLRPLSLYLSLSPYTSCANVKKVAGVQEHSLPDCHVAKIVAVSRGADGCPVWALLLDSLDLSPLSLLDSNTHYIVLLVSSDPLGARQYRTPI